MVILLCFVGGPITKCELCKKPYFRGLAWYYEKQVLNTHIYCKKHYSQYINLIEKQNPTVIFSFYRTKTIHFDDLGDSSKIDIIPRPEGNR